MYMAKFIKTKWQRGIQILFSSKLETIHGIKWSASLVLVAEHVILL